MLAIVRPSGKPISPHLLRCEPFAVIDYSFMTHALHLQQTRLVKKAGAPLRFSRTMTREL